jgi:uncharacterized protein (TIGR02001 family)
MMSSAGSYVRKLAILFCLTLLACQARSEEVGSFGSVYSFIRLTSDYRVNAVSSSDRQPAWQASLYWAAPQRFFAGLWYSTVDFNDPGNTPYELDVYGGHTFRLRHFDLVTEVFFYMTPDRNSRGATYDYTEGRIRIQDQLGPLKLRSTLGFSPSYSFGAGEVWRFEVSSAYALTEWLTVNAIGGRRWLEHRVDRSYWEAGVAARWKNITLDVRYVDTKLSRRQCGFMDWCDSALVATLTLDLPALR